LRLAVSCSRGGVRLVGFGDSGGVVIGGHGCVVLMLWVFGLARIGEVRWARCNRAAAARS
jgi:hypothetical protein